MFRLPITLVNSSSVEIFVFVTANTVTFCESVIFSLSQSQQRSAWDSSYIDEKELIDIKEKNVKLDIGDKNWEVFRQDTVTWLLRKWWYVYVIMLPVVVANIVIVTLDQPNADPRLRQVFTILDLLFLMFFAWDLMLELIGDSHDFTSHLWKMADAIIVVLTILIYTTETAVESSSVAYLRVIRILRVWRGVSLVFKLENRLVSVVDSMIKFSYLLVVMAVIMWIFVVMGLSLFGQQIPSMFGTLGLCLWTLFQFLVLESWGDFISAVSDVGLYTVGAIYLIAYSTLMSILGCHLIISIIVGTFEKKRRRDTKCLKGHTTEKSSIYDRMPPKDQDPRGSGWINLSDPMYKGVQILGTRQNFRTMWTILRLMDLNTSQGICSNNKENETAPTPAPTTDQQTNYEEEDSEQGSVEDLSTGTE